MTRIKRSKLSSLSSKPKVLALTVGVMIVFTGSFFLLATDDPSDKPSNADDTTQQSVNEEGVNYSPPTEEDAKHVDANKEAIVEKEKQANTGTTSTNGAKKKVTPVITYAGQYESQIEVGAYVGGIFEDGGICTAEFKKDTQSFKKSSKAVKNVNSVDCPVMAAKTDEFKQKGSWGVTVSYSSSSASGLSSTTSFEVK